MLDHQTESIRLDWLRSGRAPLLLDHDPTKQIGIVESAEVSSDGKARAKIRFGKGTLAESAYQDVLDGIKSNISIGYRYLDDGIILEQEGKLSKPSIYRINKWEPLEVSLVSIPADHTVGIGRSPEEQQQQTIYKVRHKVQTDISENITNSTNQYNGTEKLDNKSRVKEI